VHHEPHGSKFCTSDARPDSPEERSQQIRAAIEALRATGAPCLEDSRNPDDDQDVNEALARLEDRLDEQERAMRHVLTMLIEWFERDPSDRSSRGVA